jgi:hypothetical protein
VNHWLALLIGFVLGVVLSGTVKGVFAKVA